MSVKSIGGGLVVVGLVGGAGKGAVAGGEGVLLNRHHLAPQPLWRFSLLGRCPRPPESSLQFTHVTRHQEAPHGFIRVAGAQYDGGDKSWVNLNHSIPFPRVKVSVRSTQAP